MRFIPILILILFKLIRYISQHRPDYAALLLSLGADPNKLTDDSPAESAMDIALRCSTESVKLSQTYCHVIERP
jgi:hypothetical protein